MSTQELAGGGSHSWGRSAGTPPANILDSAESGDREASAGSLIPGSSSAESIHRIAAACFALGSLEATAKHLREATDDTARERGLRVMDETLATLRVALGLEDRS